MNIFKGNFKATSHLEGIVKIWEIIKILKENFRNLVFIHFRVYSEMANFEKLSLFIEIFRNSVILQKIFEIHSFLKKFSKFFF